VEHRIGTVDEVREAGCRRVEVNGRTIGVIAVGDRFHAIFDRCPHMAASMTAGTVSGTFVPSGAHEYVFGKDDCVIRCPWHGWEFDLETGRSLLEPDRVGIKVYDVTVVDGDVILHT